MSEHAELGLPWVADPDERDGMEWNVHVVQTTNPNMRVAFMANGPHTAVRAAHLVLAANHHHALVKALEECAIRCRYDGDLFHDQQNEMRRDASWKAQEMAETVLAALKEASDA